MARKQALRSLFVVSFAVLALAGSSVAEAGSARLLTFNTMVGIPAGLTGTQSQAVLRGISGGGLPWRIRSGMGQLSSSGHLKVEVKGLVLDAGTNAGTNPIASFRGLVSCVGADGGFVNVLTAAVPATTGAASAGGGDAEIEADVALPQPCIAPIVFVTSPGGAWFAATGD